VPEKLGDFEGRSYTIALHSTSKNRTYYIVLVDEDEANLWLSYITEAIHEAKYGPMPTIAPTSEPSAVAAIESAPPQDSVNQIEIVEPETAAAVPEPVPTSNETQPDAGAERQARLDALRAERIARDVAAQKLRELSDAGIASNEQDDALAAQAFAKELEARRKQEFEAEQSRQIAMRAAVEAEQARVAAKQAELNSQHAEAAAQAQRAQEALAAAEKAKKAEQQEWEAFISECATGFACKKHARGYFAKPHECLVFINLNSQTLSWGGKEEISMKAVTDIQPGKQTKVLSGTGNEIPADCCVGVVTVERTLDLEFPNASRRDHFVRNFKRLLARLQANQKKTSPA
jgi:chemotaxis protein histidine kinase CheA